MRTGRNPEDGAGDHGDHGDHGDSGDHEMYDELAVGWALHALEPDDEELFADHLRSCSRCARTVAETTDVMGALARDTPPAEPSTGLRDRLRAEVERTEQLRPAEDAAEPAAVREMRPATAARPGPTAGRSTPAPDERDGFDGPVAADERPSWRRILPNALVAAAVAAVLALGTWNVVLTSERDDAVASAADQQEIISTLLEPGTAVIAPVSGDSGVVATVVARDAQVQVVAQGLEVNDRKSQTYVLWGMTQLGAVPLGPFDVVSSQTDLRTVGSSATGLDDYSAYAISIEPGRSAPSSPTGVIWQGRVTS